MKQIITILTALVLFSNTAVALANPGSASFHQVGGIRWESNYQSALEQSKATSKPIMLFFTGSGWCGWCQKLDEEVLNRREFAQAMGDRMIFVKLDYPANSSMASPQLKQLGKQYAIKSYPTVILIDGQERILARTGYQAGGPQAYAQHLCSYIPANVQASANVPKSEVQAPVVDGTVLSHDAIRKAYDAAVAAKNQDEVAALLKKGLNIDRDHYFLLEQYRQLAESHSAEAAPVRERLVKADPFNQKSIQYKIAVIDSQATKSTEPLEAYLQQFGAADVENSWKVEMMISQAYLAKGQVKEALTHATMALQQAPAAVKGEVQKAIEQIKKQI